MTCVNKIDHAKVNAYIDGNTAIRQSPFPFAPLNGESDLLSHGHSIADARKSDMQTFIPLIAPKKLRQAIPMSQVARETVLSGREAIQNILEKKDSRLLVVMGPCSIHDEDAALEYAGRLSILREEVRDTLFIVMRVYFEKPRTTVGWKGLINDPYLDGTCDMTVGLMKARELLLRINEMGIPVATEMLEPTTPQYIGDLVSWSAIGARTTESQTHREVASGLSMPVGFKNSTDGSLSAALNAIQAARMSHSFPGIDSDGHTAIVRSSGNPHGHIVMRGGKQPNYDPVSLAEARTRLREKDLPEVIMVDCSHGNSGKRHQIQNFVWKNIIEQRIRGNDSLVGMMLESNLHEGNQKFSQDAACLRYGVSITDACISWETTETLIRYADQKLAQHAEQKGASWQN